MAVSAVLTATCAVRNEYLVKNYKIQLNVQNAVLYAVGSTLNICAFKYIPNPNNKQSDIGFFDGYSNPLAVGVVCINGVIGLAVTAVYKYADAITKCIASDITAVILCILSTIFFELEASITMWCGIIVSRCASQSISTRMLLRQQRPRRGRLRCKEAGRRKRRRRHGRRRWPPWWGKSRLAEVSQVAELHRPCK